MKNTVNLFQSIVAVLTGIILGGMCFFCMVMGYWIPAVIVGMLAIIFLCIGVLDGSYIEISDAEISRKFMKHKLNSIQRQELKEVGVVGIRVLGDKKKTGTRYIYFSKNKMDDAQRFQMCLQWPPKDKLYMVWNESRYAEVQQFWNHEIIEYNAGNLCR